MYKQFTPEQENIYQCWRTENLPPDSRDIPDSRENGSEIDPFHIPSQIFF